MEDKVMSKENKQEMRYYTPLIMGFIVMIIALIAPPLGSIPPSAIYAGGCFLILAASVIGMDIPAILHEVNEMKKLTIENQQNIENTNKN